VEEDASIPSTFVKESPDAITCDDQVPKYRKVKEELEERRKEKGEGEKRKGVVSIMQVSQRMD